jgi:hypothetical protein
LYHTCITTLLDSPAFDGVKVGFGLNIIAKQAVSVADFWGISVDSFSR